VTDQQQQLERNKKNVMVFYDLMFNQNNPTEAIKRYVGEVYIQQNRAVADGKEAFIECFERMAKEYPDWQACSLQASDSRRRKLCGLVLHGYLYILSEPTINIGCKSKRSILCRSSDNSNSRDFTSSSSSKCIGI
jgi:predicted SnoaL-like aldol condensation-catalyzing enzyme